MKLAWKDTLLGAILYDSETGQIIGEILETDFGHSVAWRSCRATVRGETIGEYISREFARKAVEVAVIEGQGAPP